MNALWLDKPVWMWAIFMGIVALLLILDLGVLHRTQKEITAKNSLITYMFYIAMAVAFGGWMWGVVGALVGVPLLVVVKVFCDHFARLATFGAFLSAEPAAEPPAAPAVVEDVAAGDVRPKQVGAP